MDSILRYTTETNKCTHDMRSANHYDGKECTKCDYRTDDWRYNGDDIYYD